MGAGALAAGGFGGLGAKPPAVGRFFVFFWEKKLFQFRWITFRKCLEPFESTRFLTFHSQSKKSNCLILLLLAI